ncbi:MAG TPA: TM0106 family RecB-like putative nuclease [Intrasporangium sp.]|uniref:TM0106 family RecB-like putative nuclease n=1 Tax=Intrasporangium sp. TaxID=1925024 RepID=UPI002D79EB2A|nr:TM0106 family RecB-like putative nuclease [Intrasporangium sp.]HET7396930.1 TM0106 family RecB-like putative nuclease [Intrasporangium sp.]
MQRIDGHLVLSPTDLTKHVACPHITTLDLQALDTGAAPAGAADDALNLVFAKGLEHERDYLRSLLEQGLVVEDIAALGLDRRAAEAATLDAMRRGVDVVYQATFFDGAWVGFADFLLRRERPSDLGGWSYDIADTKLARRLKVPALLQMATYAARLEALQGVAPAHLVVVTGDKEQHPWRLVDVAPYARRRRAELLDAIEDPRPTEAVRVQHCAQCRWKERCAAEWSERDDLFQVAGMRADHRAALRGAGIPTLQALAQASEEALVGVLGTAARRRLHQQARLQLRERETGRSHYELLPPEPGRGLQLLPEPDPGDVYLDFEGDPWAEGGAGREYLAGIWTRQGEFVEFWAHSFEEEARLTADLLDWLIERWDKFPDMHVYHYAPYETTALKRLTGQHAKREHELDQLLRGERFVDLYAVVRHGVRVSKGSYSIKKLEDFYWGRTRPAGDADVSDGLSSVVEYERWLALREEGQLDQSILDAIRSYNIDDVKSTLALHEWLEARRDELGADGHLLTRATGKPAEEIGEDESAEIDLAERLLEAATPQARLLAGCVGWHRREDRPEWWDYFHYGELDDDELVESAGAIGSLGAPEQIGQVKQSIIWRYPFPAQECQLKPGIRVEDVDTHKGVGEVIALDAVAGWVDVKMGKRVAPPAPRGLKGPGPINTKVMRDSIARTGELLLAGGSNLGTRLVARAVPTAEQLAPRDGETPADVVVRVGATLRGEVLAVQGPPGAGKTFAGASLIRALLDEGLTVGVTALSHAVIANLLAEVGRPALHRGTPVAEPTAEQAVPTSAGGPPAAVPAALVRPVARNEEIVEALTSGAANLVGGTAWLWSREELADAVDVLIVDEAGQFSLANAVAVSQAATSLVLLGDPQQLQQPTKAVHPHGAGVSALEHLIGEHDVIPADRGVFLDHTYRMHPSLTRFVSELAYEGRLRSADASDTQDLSRVVVRAPGRLTGTGQRWVPVIHRLPVEQASEEEADVVRGLVDDLLAGEWTDASGATRGLATTDILVVAPYNAHVAALTRALPDGVRVGTVDKFQGQQAAVVVYSLGSTSADAAPRGVGFLYDIHRLNVAVSRAKALVAVVGSPLLLDAEVHTPEDLRAVNALCRYVEEARTA